MRASVHHLEVQDLSHWHQGPATWTERSVEGPSVLDLWQEQQAVQLDLDVLLAQRGREDLHHLRREGGAGDAVVEVGPLPRSERGEKGGRPLARRTTKNHLQLCSRGAVSCGVCCVVQRGCGSRRVAAIISTVRLR